MLVLTEFLAVVVGIKLECYVILTGLEQTHASVELERNVTYFSVNKLPFVWLDVAMVYDMCLIKPLFIENMRLACINSVTI